jgi:hypothetical protein
VPQPRRLPSLVFLLRSRHTSTDNAGELLLADIEQQTDREGDSSDEGDANANEEPKGGAHIPLLAHGAAPVVHLGGVSVRVRLLAMAEEARVLRVLQTPAVHADAVARARVRGGLAGALGGEASRDGSTRATAGRRIVCQIRGAVRAHDEREIVYLLRGRRIGHHFFVLEQLIPLVQSVYFGRRGSVKEDDGRFHHALVRVRFQRCKVDA